MPEFLPVQVNVPQKRLADFHLMFAGWLMAGADDDDDAFPPDGTPPDAWDPDIGIDWKFEQNEDFPRAYKLWEKLSQNARDIFTLLLDTKETAVTAHDIAMTCGLTSPNAVAGTLTWPARYSNEMDRPLPVQWDKSDDGETRYWIPGAYLGLFKLVKQFHESPNPKQIEMLEAFGFEPTDPWVEKVKTRLHRSTLKR